MRNQEKAVAVMQPYFLPYIGYFQLMNAVDEFVIYDNIQFTKRGWIHRNRILENSKDVYISLPVKKDSDYLDVKDRCLADDFDKHKSKILSKIKNNYQKAPCFKEVFPIVENIFSFENKNLFEFIFNSTLILKEYLEIETDIIISSNIDIDHTLKSSDKVKAIVKKQKGNIYINPIGGLELYDKSDFQKDGIDLKFLKPELKPYSQFLNDFVPGLSIIDVLMFNSKAEIQDMLNNYNLV
jgi:hypothetical protein